MPAAVRREKEGHLGLYVALKRARPRARPEESALAPDLRRARCTSLELRHVRTWNAKARSRGRETRSVDVGAQPRRSISGRLEARIMAAKRPKDSLSWQNGLGWQWLSGKSRCANYICLQLVTVERRKVTYIVHAT